MRKLSAGLILLTADVFVLSFVLFFSLILREVLWPGNLDLKNYFSILPLLIFLFPAAFYMRGLYPSYGIDVIDELRDLSYSITIVFALIAIISIMVREVWEYSRLVFLMSWLLSLPLVPLGRTAVRKIFCSKAWWGIPVIIIGAGDAGEKVIKSLQAQMHLGLRPILAVDDDPQRWGYINQVPVVGGIEIVTELAKKLDVDHAIIAMPSVNRARQKEIIEKYSKIFTHTFVIPNLFGLSSLWVSSRNIGGILGLEVQQRLLKKSSHIKKRIFDVILASTIGIIVLPLMLLISLVIFIDLKGRIFFKQQRMGLHDSRFKMVKFRTMHLDAEKRLTHLLNQNEQLREEYDIYHKLRNDPRLTKLGRLLRKFSLDELPQFWNVIKGEMSLIGPRAYMPWEKVKMKGHEEIILNVKPGISGLWQVTDRNSSSFEERNYIDVYYIRNWSMFLDIYIVARTISVILLGKGG
ncbi:MAG: undecaprenyl-phosphate galactose phosphotransferase WbaP [FCB group bacterium]